jgi:hypothetical protein
MSDLSLHPVYLSARAAIVAPERAIPLTLYSAQKWLPLLGPERWCLVMLLRTLSIDSPRRSNGIKRITCSWRELADMLSVHEETVASWLKHKPIPQDKPWRNLIPTDEKAEYLSLFIPRLRYAYETYNGKTRRVGFLLEILMEDPIVPEDEVRLRQQVQMLRMQQGELGLQTYRLVEDVNRPDSNLPRISDLPSGQPDVDLDYVNQLKPDLLPKANPVQSDLHNMLVNPDNADLLPDVKQNKTGSGGYVNQVAANSPLPKSEEAGKNVNELDLLIQQLKQRKITRNLRKNAFEPILRLTETLLQDDHSGAMLYKVFNALYPERLDLYVAAVRVALEAAEAEPLINRGAVFVRAVRDFAEVAGVDLGLKRTADKETDHETVEENLGTQVPNASLLPVSPLLVNENEAIWAETQSTLSRQMTRATYDTIIQGTVLIGREDNIYLVGVKTEMAKEWLENRLRDIVQRSLSNVVGTPVRVKFTLLDVSR